MELKLRIANEVNGAIYTLDGTILAQGSTAEFRQNFRDGDVLIRVGRVRYAFSIAYQIFYLGNNIVRGDAMTFSTILKKITFAALAFLFLSTPFQYQLVQGDEVDTHKMSRNAEDAPAAERRRLLGTWKVIKTEFAGDSKSPAIGTADYFHFGEKEVVDWTARRKYGHYCEEYLVRTSTTPRQLDHIDVVYGKRLIFPSIYEWDGELLRIVITDQAFPQSNPELIEKNRPREFKTQKGDQTKFLLLLERVKDGDVTVPPRSPK